MLGVSLATSPWDPFWRGYRIGRVLPPRLPLSPPTLGRTTLRWDQSCRRYRFPVDTFGEGCVGTNPFCHPCAASGMPKSLLPPLSSLWYATEVGPRTFGVEDGIASGGDAAAGVVCYFLLEARAQPFDNPSHVLGF